MTSGGWRGKAERMIADYCLQSYRQANPRRKRGARHVPYSVPEIAQALVSALASDDEHEAKRLFMVETTGSWSLI